MKVSVIIPTYNRGHILDGALNSVFAQTFQDFEVIIIDDGSTDNTKTIVDGFIQKHPDKITYLYQKNSGNPGMARNFGIKHAKGEYIALLDSDDSWKNNKLELMVSFIESNAFDWAFSATYRIENGNNENRQILKMPEKFLLPDKKTLNLFKYGLFSFTCMPIFTGATLFKKTIFKKVDGFDTDYVVGEDSDLWMKFEEHGFKGGYLDIPLFLYNKNSTSITNINTLTLDENVRLAKKHLSLIDIDKTLLKKSYADFLWGYAPLYYRKHRRLHAVFLLMKSFLIYPEFSKILKTFKNFNAAFKG